MLNQSESAHWQYSLRTSFVHSNAPRAPASQTMHGCTKKLGSRTLGGCSRTC